MFDQGNQQKNMMMEVMEPDPNPHPMCLFDKDEMPCNTGLSKAKRIRFESGEELMLNFFCCL